MNKIRHSGILDMKDKLNFLISQIQKQPSFQIIEMNQSLIAISYGITEYEYDCYEDIFEDFGMKFTM